MGVVTGKFQLPNGSPVASGLYQWKLSQDAILNGTTSVSPPLFSGYLDTSGAMTATFVFNDVLNTATGQSTNYQLTVKDITGRQVWNETYYLQGNNQNLNLAVAGPGGILVISNPTYRTVGVVSPAASVLMTIQGSATKTVNVNRLTLVISGATAASTADLIVGISAGVTGGTPTTLTAAKMNSADATATAAPLSYAGTATLSAPTLLLEERLTYPAFTSTVASLVRDWTFGNVNDEPIVLNGVNQYLYVKDGNGVAAGCSGNLTVEWSEQ